MTHEQTKARAALSRALNKCNAAGLEGGVFEGVFCVWPVGEDPMKLTETDWRDFLNAFTIAVERLLNHQ